MKLEAHKLEVKSERPPTSELKKWLDVPADDLLLILSKHVKREDNWAGITTDDAKIKTIMVEIEAIAHVTFEKEPEKD